MISVTPNERSLSIVISRSVFPPTSTSALGLLSVSGRSLVPSPAAKIMAFMKIFSWRGFYRLGGSRAYRFCHRRFKSRRLESHVPHFDLNAASAAQPFRQLFGQKDRPVLSACAPKRDHQTLKPALLIARHTRVHQRKDAGEILVNAFLLVQVLNHGCIFAGQLLESFFPSRIRQAPPVKNESSAVSRFILGHSLMK